MLDHQTLLFSFSIPLNFLVFYLLLARLVLPHFHKMTLLTYAIFVYPAFPPLPLKSHGVSCVARYQRPLWIGAARADVNRGTASRTQLLTFTLCSSGVLFWSRYSNFLLPHNLSFWQPFSVLQIIFVLVLFWWWFIHITFFLSGGRFSWIQKLIIVSY